jgi:Domain of unknown function (DUF4397)
MKLHAGVLRAARAAGALALIASAGGAVLASGMAPAGASSTTSFGWLRLAHLSPNTPAVDVYLYSVGKPTALAVLRHVAYGDESPYERVAAGDYTVAMRSAGAAPGSKPVLSTLVDVAGGHAYTVAGMGPLSALRLQVLSDQLSTPPGKALVRVIQASLQDKRVNVKVGTQTVATGLQFGTATNYVTVTPGTRSASVTSGSAKASDQVSFAAGSIHTLVVLDDPGHLTIQVLEDAAGSSAVPVGPAGTGFGGTAARPGPALVPWLAAVLAAMMLAAGGAIGLRARRTGAHARTY